MDEPDVDELAWMACQQLPDDDDFLADVNDADDLEPSEFYVPPAEEDNRPSFGDKSDRKRVHSDIAQELVNNKHSPEKRARSAHPILPPSAVAHEPSCTAVSSAEVELLGTSSNSDPVEHHPLPHAFKSADYLPSRMASSIIGESMPVTEPNGSRVYVKVDRSAFEIVKSHRRHAASAAGLLVEPIDVMFERAEEVRLQKIVNESAGVSLEQTDGHIGETNDQLWVDKYAPKSFTDLLSDEQTNRQVLHWLKQWDPCVFGQEAKSSTSNEVLVALRRKLAHAEGKGFHKAFRRDQCQNSKMIKDVHLKQEVTTSNAGSPLTGFVPNEVKKTFEKVLLLCGPPGLGKTTLAHIAAKHCGYRIVEINASDDRVAATLTGRIRDAVQMKSVTGDCRPNCLIIDEIDGAVGGSEGRSAIKQLVDIVTAVGTKSATAKDTNSQDGHTRQAAKTSKKGAVESLARPIICICNDLYAPALRPLRQVARIHIFSRPHASRVVTRIKRICEQEGFHTNIQALTKLAEYAECDIRACLNTLQFLKQKGFPLTSVNAESQVNGSKDMTRNAYDIWGKVFQKTQKPSGILAGKVKPGFRGLAPDQLQFLNIYDLISKHAFGQVHWVRGDGKVDDDGDYELSVDGVYENLLNTGYQDASLSKTVKCVNAICDWDIRNRRVYSKNHFFLNEYQPSTLMTIRSLVAKLGRPNIQWPRSFQRYKTEHMGRIEMFNTWRSRMSPVISRNISISQLTSDILSPLLAILSPRLRPVALQLFTPSEKETMKQLVNTMVCFGLTYKPKVDKLGHTDSQSDWHDHGQFCLHPAVNIMANFEGHNVRHPQLAAALRLMLGHEVELERIRRESAAAVKEDADSVQPIAPLQSKREDNKLRTVSSAERFFKPQPKKPELGREKQNDQEEKTNLSKKIDDTAPDSASIPSKEVKLLKSLINQKTSFFDRWKKPLEAGHEKHAEGPTSNQRDLRPFLYKYHEGFTNAIRRPMRVREFF